MGVKMSGARPVPGKPAAKLQQKIERTPWCQCARRGVAIAGLGLLLGLMAMPARAQNFETVDGMKTWMARSDHQGTIPPGTQITMSNWQQYEQFMPPGMVELFHGSHFWKMPTDIQMTVDPGKPTPLSHPYVQASEQYGSQTKVVHEASGHYALSGYVAGAPFPNPSDPDKGYKLLADNWFAYVPNLYVNSPDNPLRSCTQDRFGNINCTTADVVYRQVGYNTDPGVPRNLPQAPNDFFTEWIMVETPEQSRYTASLTIFHKDYEKWQDSYVFVPALRRSLRLSVTARCSPAVGSDFVQDDYKTIGFNGGLALFQAKYLGQRKILSFGRKYDLRLSGNFPENYDMPLGWPKPSWGHWELKDSDILDVRRIPSEAAGYCYGSRMMFLDANVRYALWEDIYDSNLKLWKVTLWSPHVRTLPGVGETITNETTGWLWDIQNDHMTVVSSASQKGSGASFNEEAPAEFHNYVKYGTPGGLMTIMR